MFQRFCSTYLIKSIFRSSFLFYSFLFNSTQFKFVCIPTNNILTKDVHTVYKTCNTLIQYSGDFVIEKKKNIKTNLLIICIGNMFRFCISITYSKLFRKRYNCVRFTFYTFSAAQKFYTCVLHYYVHIYCTWRPSFCWYKKKIEH